MRHTVHSVIKNHMSKHITATRIQNKWTKKKMSEALDMDERSYAYLEKESSACGIVTFVLYLLFVLKDDEWKQMLYELREQILTDWENQI